jgi:hypothetical protein
MIELDGIMFITKRTEMQVVINVCHVDATRVSYYNEMLCTTFTVPWDL